MTVVYTPKKGRYVVRENGGPYRAYQHLAEACSEANQLQFEFPDNDFDVVDTQPENEETK